jgi:hypothetical protein
MFSNHTKSEVVSFAMDEKNITNDIMHTCAFALDFFPSYDIRHFAF